MLLTPFFIHLGISNFNCVFKFLRNAYLLFFNLVFSYMLKLSMILQFVLDTFTPEWKLLSVSFQGCLFSLKIEDNCYSVVLLHKMSLILPSLRLGSHFGQT